MIAVIFEVEPAVGMKERYLDHAANLRPMLDGMEGSTPSSGSKASPTPTSSCPSPSSRMRRPSSAGETPTPTAPPSPPGGRVSSTDTASASPK